MITIVKGKNAMNDKRKLNIKEIKQLAIDILKDFHEICEKNKLRYSVAYGTLLGTIRHEGFIPWDDDIDIIMPRTDFEKFTKIANGQLDDNHRFISIDVEKNFMAPLAKIINTSTSLYEKEHMSRITLGVYIDIFVYDGLAESKKKQARAFRIANILQKGWSFCECASYGKTIVVLRPIRKICNKTMLARYFSKEINRRAKRYPFESSEYMGNNMFVAKYEDRNNTVFKSEEFQKLKDYKFESITVKGFDNYDLFLSQWYADYMKLPPKAQQVSNHDFDVYWN